MYADVGVGHSANLTFPESRRKDIQKSRSTRTQDDVTRGKLHKKGGWQSLDDSWGKRLAANQKRAGWADLDDTWG